MKQTKMFNKAEIARKLFENQQDYQGQFFNYKLNGKGSGFTVEEKQRIIEIIEEELQSLKERLLE